MAIRLTESDLNKMNRRNKASMIIKENCNKVIRENKSVSYEQIFESITITSNDLHLRGVNSNKINEGMFDALADFFSTTPAAFGDTIKEKVFSWLLPKIGVEGEMLEFLKISLGNLELKDYALFLSPIDNCEKISDKITDGIAEYTLALIGKKFANFGGGIFSDTIRNSLADVLDKSFTQDLQDKFGPIVCNKIRSAFGSDAKEEIGKEILGAAM
jgi:hypothetical protein